MAAMSVDVRTRVDGEQATVDPARFFEDDLPAALERGRAPAGRGPPPRFGSRRCRRGRRDRWTLQADGPS